MTTQTDEEREQEMREVAWEIVGNLSIMDLISDCAESLVEAYKVNEELYLQDKLSLEEEG